MIEKEFVYENILRFKMVKRALPVLKQNLIEKSKRITNKKSFSYYSVSECINVINDIDKKNDFSYYDTIVFLICFSSDFVIIENEFKNNIFDLNKNFKREDYWEYEDIDFREGLFFTYTFFNQTYRTEASIDLKKIYEKISSRKGFNEQELNAKIYIDFMKKIKKKS